MGPWYISSLELTSRLLLALILGGLIGFERERNNHAAGFRTHILVCLGSALLMLISEYAFTAFVGEPQVRLDPSRLAAQVIPSIGFLGAGTIMRNGLSITGLTTAASLWVAAAIGLAAGSGFYFGALLTTGMVLISLWILNKVEQRYFRDKRIYTMKIETYHRPGTLGTISSMLENRGVIIRKLSLLEETEQEQHKLEITLIIKVPKPNTIVPVTDAIQQVEGVRSISVDS